MMNLSKRMSAGLVAAGAIGLVCAMPAAAQTATADDTGLASQTLADGQATRAVAMLEAQLIEHPGDPALLINLGIAHAQNGDDEEARARFEAALKSRDVVDLEMANGRTTDSRRLARHALAMLERGEFRPAEEPSDRLSLRN